MSYIPRDSKKIEIEGVATISATASLLEANKNKLHLISASAGATTITIPDAVWLDGQKIMFKCTDLTNAAKIVCGTDVKLDGANANEYVFSDLQEAIQMVFYSVGGHIEAKIV